MNMTSHYDDMTCRHNPKVHLSIQCYNRKNIKITEINKQLYCRNLYPGNKPFTGHAVLSIGGNDRLVAFLSLTSASTRVDFKSHTVLTS